MTAASGRLARRAGWTLVGQALSSSSNFLVTLWALATVDTGQFAALSLCVTTFLLCTQASRALVSTPVLLLHSEESGTALPRECGDALGVATGFGLVAAAVVALGATTAAAMGAVHADLFLVLAAALPALQYQDTLRHVCIARHRPALAAASDASWVALQLFGFAILSSRGSPSATALFATWAGAGVIAAAWVGAVLRAAPRMSASTAWLRRHAPLWRRLVVELVANAGSYYLIAYGLAVLSRPEELGRLRAAQALFGPVSVLLLGGTVLGVPESLRARRDSAALRRFAAGLSVALAVLAGVSGACLYALLPVLGDGFLGGAWDTARPLLPLLAAFGAGIGASAGAVSGLRALEDGRWIVRAQLVRGALAVAVGLPAANSAGAGGALVGLAVAEWLFATAAWVRFAGHKAVAGSGATGRDEVIPSVMAAAGIDTVSAG